ncbi:ankyrin repeat domain-containing protein [Sorangium sp. So ce1128]
MIHQHIFASPRPGMSDKDFLDYWIHVHAVRYASKIPQFRRYLIDSLVPSAAQTSPRVCVGVAEIWFENEEEQLASLQSEEFLMGARRDEPSWAAFWRTFVLDTAAHEILAGPPPRERGGMVKLFVLLRRRPGMTLSEFRRFSLGAQAERDMRLPGLRRYLQCHTRQGAYAVGEALLDAVYQLWFDSAEDAEAMLRSPEYAEARKSLAGITDPEHLHMFLATETWIIGPEPRPAGLDARLVEAVWNGDRVAVRVLLGEGASPDARDPATGLTALMIAAGRADAEAAQLLLGAGADVFAVDSRAGATALHKACQGGSVEVARMLVEAGASVDAPVYSTGHTPLVEAVWFKQPAVVELLLQRNAGLRIPTHYGFSMERHIEYEAASNALDKEKFVTMQRLIRARERSDEARVQGQQLMAAVTANDVEAARRLIEAGAAVDERYPVLNGFNDAHTPLLVAARDGHTEIVKLLLEAGADVNATEPTFGAVPLHKAVYNGRTDITAIIAAWPGVALDHQGATNGYTPLHDALWHGFEACARILIGAGARLDLRGHDGKTPLDIAAEVFGEDHDLVRLIASTAGAARGTGGPAS